jgi:release factor glutamine methyltransferase
MTEQHLVDRLRAAGCVFAEDEARVLLGSASSAAELEAMTARRVEGEPLEYVVGWAEFCGLRIGVDATVFIPRARTEFLVAVAVELTPPSAVVVDLCCGSGALGLALAASVPGIELLASDIDAAAVACARRNGVEAVQGDLFDALPEGLRGRVDVLLANTPYVPTGELDLMPREARLYEAAVTLDGGSDGLDLQRRVAAGAAHWLAPGGAVLVEASERQASAARAIFDAAGLSTQVRHDDDRDATVIVGTLPQ